MKAAPVRNFPTTEQDAEFDAHVRKWAEKLGLHDWNIYRRQSRAVKAAADVDAKIESRHAGYRTGDFGKVAIDSHELEGTALHEMLHVFLADLCYSYEHSDDSNVYLGAEHRVIHALMRLLLKKEA